MNHPIYRTSWRVLIALLVVAAIVHPVMAGGVSVSGSYEIVEKTDLGSQVRVVVQFHLTNHEQNPVFLEGVMLSDFAYPHASGAHAAPIHLRPGAVQDVSQELVIPRAEFKQWQRGLRPRIVLQLQTDAGMKMTQAVRLEHVPGRGAK